jgi:hypothetical protein
MSNYTSYEFMTSLSPAPAIVHAFQTMSSTFQRSETHIPSSGFKRMGGFTKPSNGTDFQRMELFSDKVTTEAHKTNSNSM